MALKAVPAVGSAIENRDRGDTVKKASRIAKSSETSTKNVRRGLEQCEAKGCKCKKYKGNILGLCRNTGCGHRDYDHKLVRRKSNTRRQGSDNRSVYAVSVSLALSKRDLLRNRRRGRPLSVKLNDSPRLRQERVYHVPPHVREAEVAALVASDEPQMVQA
jgi:hypothetical protein